MKRSEETPSPTAGEVLQAPTISDIDETLINQIVDSLAEIRNCDSAAIHQAMSSGGGDCRVDSLEGLNIIVSLEGKLGCRLPGVENLKPQQYTSINSLATLVSRLS